MGPYRLALVVAVRWVAVTNYGYLFVSWYLLVVLALLASLDADDVIAGQVSPC